MEYLIGIRGVQSGPFPEAEIRAKIAANQFPPGTLCWAEGWSQWRPLESVFTRDGAGLPVTVPFPAGDLRRTYNDGSFNNTLPEMSGLALASLVLGLASLIIIFPLIPAIICGHLACSQIKKSEGRKTGRGVAITGLVISYFMLMAVPTTVGVIVIPAYQEFRSLADQAVVQLHLLELDNAAQNFMRDKGVEEVTYAELIGNARGVRSQVSYIEPIIPRSGEDYTELVIKKTDTKISVKLGDGCIVVHERIISAGASSSSP